MNMQGDDNNISSEEPDTEGHGGRAYYDKQQGIEATDDVEGHLRPGQLTNEDDVEGHLRPGQITEDEDVEGHLRPGQ